LYVLQDSAGTALFAGIKAMVIHLTKSPLIFISVLSNCNQKLSTFAERSQSQREQLPKWSHTILIGNLEGHYQFPWIGCAKSFSHAHEEALPGTVNLKAAGESPTMSRRITNPAN